MSDQTAIRHPKRGKAHRRSRHTSPGLVGHTDCGHYAINLTETIPLERTAPEDRCKTCWPSPSTGAAEVRVGQVWRSCDWRDHGRKIEVLEVGDTHAKVQSPDGRGRVSRIRLDRFRQGSTGYELVRTDSSDR